METKIYNQLPDEAKEIRLEVFVKEQGFEEEFDDIDETAAHIVLFDGSHPVGVCRVFTDPESGRVMIGRVAVRKAFRGKGLGADIIKAAEEYAAENGVNEIWIHSQEQAAGFYSAIGYKDTGIHDVEEGCPHILMRKVL